MTNKVKNIDLENRTHWFFDDIMGGYKLTRNCPGWQ